METNKHVIQVNFSENQKEDEPKNMIHLLELMQLNLINGYNRYFIRYSCGMLTEFFIPCPFILEKEVEDKSKLN